MHDSKAGPSPAQPSPAQPSPAQPSPAPSSCAKQLKTAQSRPRQPSTDQHSPEETNTAQKSPELGCAMGAPTSDPRSSLPPPWTSRPRPRARRKPCLRCHQASVSLVPGTMCSQYGQFSKPQFAKQQLGGLDSHIQIYSYAYVTCVFN